MISKSLMSIQYEHAYLRVEFASTVMTINPILVLQEIIAPLEMNIPIGIMHFHLIQQGTE